ncbi:MAG: FkbM family methyltransferase [Acidobacteriia bacterium]|nr:FkbM family methyltransferase [Terriglobia bacterium]
MASFVRRAGGVLMRALQDPFLQYRRMRWRCGLTVFQPLLDGAGVYLYPAEELSRHLLYLDFEGAVRRAMQDVLAPGMTFIDVGANLGLYTVLAAKLVGATGRVLAFEPSERDWKRARRAIERNGLQNVELFRVALSNADGTISLNVCEPAYGGCNSVGTVTHEAAVGHVSHVEQVTCRTLDCFLAEKQVRRVDVMKLDVEGAEQLVLLGGKELFTGAGAPVLFCELSDWTARGLGTTAAETWDLMVSYGYKVYSIQRSEGGYRLAQCPRTERIEYDDVLALKPGHVSDLAGRIRFPQ